MFNFKIIEKFLRFPYKFEKTLAPIMIFLLVFYGGNASPKLPDLIVSLFQNPAFRIFILSLIVYKGNSNPSMAILISVGFTMVMDRINKQSITENFNNRIEKFSNKLEDDKLDIISDIAKQDDREDVIPVIPVISDQYLSKKDDQYLSKKDDQSISVGKNDQSISVGKDVIPVISDQLDDIYDNDLEIDNTLENDDFLKEDICDGMCSKINYNEFEGKIKSDEFSQEYFNTIKNCMVVDLLQNKSNNEVNNILKKMDLTHNDIDGPIGTAYVNYTDAVSRLNL